MTRLAQLIEAAKAWQAQDPDPETFSATQGLIDEGDENRLEDHFGKRIGFGTAGLRGELGPGPNRMNRVLVAQAAAGIGNLLASKGGGRVVIGYDARKNSKQFALDSAEIFAGLGIETFLFDSLAATPLLAFAVRELGCDYGVMVTASHNPPADNGYKVYEKSGSQIVSPLDKEISAEIELVANRHLISDLARRDNYRVVPSAVTDKYLATIASLFDKSVNRGQLRIVYSAMHGVGTSFIERAFRLIGLEQPIAVKSQSEPDGTFPTVSFPNPEEPGAMDEAISKALREDADLILVNDPDADRLAVVFRDASGELVQLSGDEVGLILGEELAGRNAGKGGNLACSIVSSSALGRIAASHGLGFRQTLTGFKWISRVEDLVFGYEEALGYCVDWQNVRDKDGISAAIVISDIATRLAAEGKSLGDELNRIRERDGYFATSQISIRVEKLSQISLVMEKIRSAPPKNLAGSRVRFTDLADPNGELVTDAIRLDLEDSRRVIIRPSGTEPKLKCYLQAEASDGDSARRLLTELENQMRELLA